MIEVFTTDIPNSTLGKRMVKRLKSGDDHLEIDFDIERSIVDYPRDHSILRVEGEQFDAQHIISLVQDSGHKCHILKDELIS